MSTIFRLLRNLCLMLLDPGHDVVVVLDRSSINESSTPVLVSALKIWKGKEVRLAFRPEIKINKHYGNFKNIDM